LITEFVSNILPYITLGVFLCGAIYKFLSWARAPPHLRWALFPIPSMKDQLKYMASEIFIFRNLANYNRSMWVGAWFFHLGITLLAVWGVLVIIGAPYRTLMYFIGVTGGIFITSSAVYLLFIRAVLPQMRALSTFVEYFNLALWVIVGGTGLYTGIFTNITLPEVREYIISIFKLSPLPIEGNSLFLLHILFVQLLLMYLPFSRMFHFVSKYFSYHKIRWAH
jgi:nitrate reductase gamma subunit